MVRSAMNVALVAVLQVATALIVSVPAQADPPQCDNGPIVMDNCPSGSLCTAVIDGQCVGAQPPLLLPPPPVRVGIEGGVGVGA